MSAVNATGTVIIGYDQLDRVTTTQDMFGVVQNYSFDDAGRLTQQSDSLGNSVTSVYDAADRLIHRTLTAPPSLPLQVDIIYNHRNLPITQTRSHAGLTDLTVSFTYDQVGRQKMAQYVHWSGQIYEYDTGYDQAGRATGVLDDGISTTYAYDAGDQLTGYTRSNSSGSVLGTGAYSYNINGVDNNGKRTMADKT
jgi:YD repeat-containing protein